MSPLGNLIKEHGLEYHICADDTQLYIAFNPLDKDSSGRAKLKMEECITIIKDFLLENTMKVNDGKRELPLMRTHNKLKNINIDDIKIGKVTIKQQKKQITLD